MGAAGAAVATVIRQIVAMLMCCISSTKIKEVKIKMRGFRPRKRIIGEIYKVGVPSVVMQAITSVMIVASIFILVYFYARISPPPQSLVLGPISSCNHLSSCRFWGLQTA